MNKIFFSIAFVFVVLFNAQATIQLPAIFCNNMVLQQNAYVKIWGTANYGEKLTIVGSWSDKRYAAKTDKEGNWSTEISTPEAGGPYTLTVSGSATITFDNLMIGEVWLCTGQSNMGFTAGSGLLNEQEEVAAAYYPNIRLFKVQRAQADEPQNDCIGQWVECSPETMRRFSSVGYFFGRELHQELDVPIGLIESTWGGTSIELWTPKDAVYKDPVAHESAQIATKWPIENVSTMFNAMIHPLIPYQIAGNIWYQGESNRYNISGYSHLMGLMINAWRKSWGYEFPFFYVQIAPFRYNEPYTAALIREQQLQAMNIPNTGMVVTTDVGNPEDIHPKNKQVVGHRLALWALSETYNREHLVHSGPIYQGMKIKGSKIELSFDYAEDGLQMKGEKLVGFEVAGADQQFYPAEANIKGAKIEVGAKTVRNPVAVRFGFSNTSEPNLYNNSGLPASPFRTDRWFVDISPESARK